MTKKNKLSKISKILILTLCVCFFSTINVMAKALTVDGNAEVVDETSDEGKEFLTVQSRGGNIYYIIIDRQKDENNVYFLNAVDEIDLLSFATDSTGNNYHLTGVEVIETTTEATTEITTEATTETMTEELILPTKKESNKIGVFPILSLIAIPAVLIGYLYFKHKRKITDDEDNEASDTDDTDDINSEEDSNTLDESDAEDYSSFFDSDNTEDDIN